ncbi:MAG TPA: hypothetical protein VHU40_16335, partial [Polyangia bacterium]|nr:hypothetical protein [Polyangia bacterium]
SIPAAASVVVFLVIVSHGVQRYQQISQGLVAAVVLVLSYLMVSRIRFRSFKDIRPNKKTGGVVLLVGAVWIVMRLNQVHDVFIFLAMIAAYIALGLAEEVNFLRRRIAERMAAKAGQAQPPLAPEPLDEEVLAELGAFDPQEDDGDGAATSDQDRASDPATKRA